MFSVSHKYSITFSIKKQLLRFPIRSQAVSLFSSTMLASCGATIEGTPITNDTTTYDTTTYDILGREIILTSSEGSNYVDISSEANGQGYIINTGDGEDAVIGSMYSDIVYGGKGSDSINSSEGNDIFVFLGTRKTRQFSASDYNFSGHDLSPLLSQIVTFQEASLESDIASIGEIANGNTGEDYLVAFGSTHFEVAEIADIEMLHFDGSLFLTMQQLAAFSSVTGNGVSSKLFIVDDTVVNDTHFALQSLTNVSLVSFETNPDLIFNSFLRSIFASDVSNFLNIKTLTINPISDLSYLQNKTFSRGTRIVDEQGVEIDYANNNITFRMHQFDDDKTSVILISEQIVDYSNLLLLQRSGQRLDVIDILFIGVDKNITNDVISFSTGVNDNNLFALTDGVLFFSNLPIYAGEITYNISINVFDADLETAGDSNRYDLSIQIVEENDQAPTDLEFVINATLVQSNGSIIFNMLPKLMNLGTFSTTDLDQDNNQHRLSIVTNTNTNFNFVFIDNSIFLSTELVGDYSISITVQVEDTFSSGETSEYEEVFDFEFSISNSSVLLVATEGESVTFSVNLTQPATSQTTVRYKTSAVENFNSGFYNPGVEVLARSGSLVFDVGEQTKTVTIQTIDDTSGSEHPDFFTLDLTTENNVSAYTEKAVFVLSNDPSYLQRSIDLKGISNFTITENNNFFLKPNFDETHTINFDAEYINFAVIVVDFSDLWTNSPIEADLDNYNQQAQETIQYFVYDSDTIFSSATEVAQEINDVGDNLILRFTQETDFVISWIRNANDVVYSRFTVNNDNYFAPIVEHISDVLIINDRDSHDRNIVYNPDRYGTDDRDVITLDTINTYYAFGGDDDITISIEGYNTLVSSGPGNDIIRGYNHSDIIIADNGDDFLEGNGGDDFLIGGKGQDTLTGGEGKDGFYFYPNDFDYQHQADIITDFNYYYDFLVLLNFGLYDIREGNVEIIKLAADSQTSDNSLSLIGTAVSHLNDADIIVYNNDNDDNGFLSAYNAYVSLNDKILDSLEFNQLSSSIFFWENTDNNTVMSYVIDSGISGGQVVAYDIAIFQDKPIDNFSNGISKWNFSASPDDVIKNYINGRDSYLRINPADSVINYSFISADSSYTDITQDNHKNVIKEILKEISYICNLTFVENDVNTDLAFNLADYSRDSVLGRTNYNYDGNAYFGGKTIVSVSNSRFGSLSSWEYHEGDNQLSNGVYYTLIHEILHALGAKHPGDYNGNTPQPFLADVQDYGVWTTMSYSPSYDSDYSPGTPMLLDVIFLHNTYGENNNARTGDTRYGFNASDEVMSSLDFGEAGNVRNIVNGTIWDGGGIDTFDASLYSVNQVINLSGTSSIGGNRDNVHILSTSMIENAIGGSGNDYITGNSLDNRLEGGEGKDSFIGYGGSDTFVGGGGDDKFIFIDANDTQIDIITDFTIGSDLLDFTRMFITNPVESSNILDYIGYSYDSGEDRTTISIDVDTFQLGEAALDIVYLEGISTITDSNFVELFYLA